MPSLQAEAVAGALPVEQKRAHIPAFIGAYVGWIFDYYEVSLLTLMIVPIAKEFGLTSGQTAFLFSMQLLFLAIGGVGFGTLADKLGRKKILFWTIVIYCAGTLARAFTFNYSWLMVWTIIAALGIGGEYGVGQTLVSEVAPIDKRGWWGGLLYGGIFVGIALAAIVGGYLEPVVGWRWTFAISTLPVLIAIYIRTATPESDVWQAKIEKQGVDWSQVFKASFLVPFFQCLIASCLQFFAYYGITTFLPTYLTKHGVSITHASWWVFFTAIGGIVGNTVGSYTNDRWGRRVTLSYLALIAAVGGIVLFFTWKYLLTSSWILVPFFALYFGSNGATVFGVLFSELFSSDVRSTGVSAALQIGRGLAFFPPLIAASMSAAWGYQSVVLLGGLEFLALALWAWTFKETRGMKLEA